jgi:hypothetical protein
MAASLVGGFSDTGGAAAGSESGVYPLAQGMIAVAREEGINPDHGEERLAVEPEHDAAITGDREVVIAGADDDCAKPFAECEPVGRSCCAGTGSKLVRDVSLETFGT